MKRISIITINKNNAKGLRRTINSVVNYACHQNIEYIVIDGNSNDDSVSIINAFSQYIDNWVSEADTGIYNAMNKGINMANGRYLLFLNSGDVLVTDLKNLIHSIPENVDIYTCKDNKKEFQWCFEKNSISFFYVYLYSLKHSNTFIKKELLDQLGGYNESYRIVSDWEFFLKALFIHHASIAFFHTAIAENEPAGISAKQMELHMRERICVRNKLFPYAEIDIAQLLIYKRSRFIRLFDKLLKNRIVRRFL